MEAPSPAPACRPSGISTREPASEVPASAVELADPKDKGNRSAELRGTLLPPENVPVLNLMFRLFHLPLRA